MRCSHRRSPTGTNGTGVSCVRLRSRRNGAEIRTATKRLPSNKEGKSYKAFAEGRLRTLSPEISPSVVPTLYRTDPRHNILHHAFHLDRPRYPLPKLKRLGWSRKRTCDRIGTWAALCFPVLSQWELSQICKERQNEHRVQKYGRMHLDDMKFSEHHIEGRKKEQRTSEVAMHSPASSGVCQTRDGHHEECWNPKPRARACP